MIPVTAFSGKKVAIFGLGGSGLASASALLAGARLLVRNDTGVSHVAAGLRTPSVVISTGDNPDRWAPPDAARHHVLHGDRGLDTDEVLAHAESLRDFQAHSDEWLQEVREACRLEAAIATGNEEG